MRIKSVYISAFGGLEDKRIEFKDGFNVFYGENEKGKTTVMNFIKMMFYGTVRGSAQISKDISFRKYSQELRCKYNTYYIYCQEYYRYGYVMKL